MSNSLNSIPYDLLHLTVVSCSIRPTVQQAVHIYKDIQVVVKKEKKEHGGHTWL